VKKFGKKTRRQRMTLSDTAVDKKQWRELIEEYMAESRQMMKN